jgi:SAM-dependent methyltransferase
LPDIETVFEQLGNMLDTRPGIRDSYEQRVATKPKVLDIGGRNHTSNSARRLRLLGAGTSTRIIATDVIPDYGPDLLDDITNTTIQPNSFDGIYCDAVLEHVTDYQMAISNIHSILRPGGEAFLYVPFFFQFHDKMDYHRFTISELARMVSGFSEAKIFVPGNGTDVGYGWVLWDVITYGKIRMLPRLHSALASIVNRALELTVRVWYRRKARPFTLDQAIFFAVNLNYNHGFCAWVRK